MINGNLFGRELFGKEVEPKSYTGHFCYVVLLHVKLYVSLLLFAY